MSLEIADRIRSRREALGLSRAALGRVLGVTGQAIANWESGARQVSLELVGQLAAALHTTPHELIGSQQTAPIDPGVLAQALACLDSVAATLGVPLSHDQRARILSFLYSTGGALPAEDVLALCRLVA